MEYVWIGFGSYTILFDDVTMFTGGWFMFNETKNIRL
jgi:hypothetical protein